MIGTGFRRIALAQGLLDGGCNRASNPPPPPDQTTAPPQQPMPQPPGAPYPDDRGQAGLQLAG